MIPAEEETVRLVTYPALRREEAVCPNCDGRGLESFYAVTSVPVNSCVLLDTPEAARAYPHGTLDLAHCDGCGFVTNLAFDAVATEYSARYEETQAFSATFNRFARGLAERLVTDYAVRERTVLEIGCGKGEFLVGLCEAGNNRGIGIDPGYRPERTSSPAAERIEFIQDFYDERYAHLDADIVVCRHTLEHIAPTRAFLTALRSNLERRPDALVFFELPETLRVLREGAFWDFYHEHCSYFTPGSLARLFRQTGFDLLELSLDYDDQYIVLVARPASGPTAPALSLEHDLAETASAVSAFPARCAERMEYWRNEIAESVAAGRGVVLWGSGSKGVAFLTTLGGLPEVNAVVDINPHKHGKAMPGTGHPIVGPEELEVLAPGLVIAMNPVYREEIQRDLDRLGLDARLVTL